jgi:tRNA (cmo5U34)-methyltransferase
MTINTRFTGTIGDDYDLFKLAVPHFNEIQAEVARLVNAHYESSSLTRSYRVLEIGSGSGETTKKVLGASENITVFALDNDPAMLQQARHNLASFGDRVQFICSDALSELMHLNSACFDAFVSGFTLHNLEYEYRQRLVREVSRLLTPAGIYVNADKYAPNNPVDHAKDLVNQLDAFKIFDEMSRPDLRESWTKHYQEDEYTKWTEADEVRVLGDSGFNDFKCVYRRNMEAIFSAMRG